jgi:hypothetical protein
VSDGVGVGVAVGVGVGVGVFVGVGVSVGFGLATLEIAKSSIDIAPRHSTAKPKLNRMAPVGSGGVRKDIRRQVPLPLPRIRGLSTHACQSPLLVWYHVRMTPLPASWYQALRSYRLPRLTVGAHPLAPIRTRRPRQPEVHAETWTRSA